MAKRRTDWIVIDAKDQVARCNRCGGTAPLTSVINQPVAVFLGFSQGFIKAHKGCKEKK